ncbi:MAG: hypothetical protein Q8O43_00130 [Dehalococcoidia bacterium]|nr:hypothetical protein [Dehalococcoidia bacterium]
MIGIIVIAVVVIPVVVLILEFVLEKPRTFRIPSLFLGSVVAQIVGVVVLMALMGALLGLLIPQ